MSDAIISLSNVQKTYRTDRMETIALQRVSMEIHRGEFVSIMGPSGSGKSTLLNLLGLLDSPTEGEVILEGKVVSTLRERELATVRNRKLGFVFQSFHLIPDLRVIDNVELPMLYGEIGSKERRSRALAALETVGLKARTHHFPTQLSGGQQQRVAIARAIVGDPTLLLADEPTGNLDSHMSDEIMNLLRQLNSERGATIVMVTHDASRGAQTHRIIRMCDGQLVDEGKKRCLKAI